MLFFIHLLFAITYLCLIYIRHFKLCVVDYPPPPQEIVSLSLIQTLPFLCSRLPPPLRNSKFDLGTLFVGTCNHSDFMLFLFSHKVNTID